MEHAYPVYRPGMPNRRQFERRAQQCAWTRLDVALIPPAAIGFFPVRPCQPAAPDGRPCSHGTRHTCKACENIPGSPRTLDPSQANQRQAEELQPAARSCCLSDEGSPRRRTRGHARRTPLGCRDAVPSPTVQERKWIDLSHRCALIIARSDGSEKTSPVRTRTLTGPRAGSEAGERGHRDFEIRPLPAVSSDDPQARTGLALTRIPA